MDAPPAVGAVLSQALDLLAAIPSVIYGMWGLFVLVPLMQDHVQPFLSETLGLGRIPFFGEYGNGFGFLTASLILGLMILPYMSAVMRNVFKMTPGMLRESAYGVGCTRWETARDIVMRYGVPRAAGRHFHRTRTCPRRDHGGALRDRQRLHAAPTPSTPAAPPSPRRWPTTSPRRTAFCCAVLFALGLVLLTMSLGVQVLAQYYLVLTSAKRGER